MNTTPGNTIDTRPSGTFHIAARCVRGAWLCGRDPQTGSDYAHRERHIEARIAMLAQNFSVCVEAHAITSHLMQLVLRSDVEAPSRWEAGEVMRRWFNAACHRDESDAARMRRIVEALRDPGRVTKARAKLGSISGFLQQLQGPIARVANLEDGCTGHFWEKRSRFERLPDEMAVINVISHLRRHPEEVRVVPVRSERVATVLLSGTLR